MTVRSRSTFTGIAIVTAAGILAGCSSGGTAPQPATQGTSSAASATSSSSAVMSSADMSSTVMSGAFTSGPAEPSAANVTESNPAGDIPDTQAFVDYSPAGGGYRVQVPEGWARTDSAAATLFSDKYNTIRIETAAARIAPTVQSGQAELSAMKATEKGFTPGGGASAARQAGAAVLITYQSDSAVNQVTGKVVSQAVERYEFFQNGTTVVLTLSAPVGSDNVDPWRTITDSFRWTA